jgi:hypothetical protein
MTIRKVAARNMYIYIYIYICLQFEELSSHLPVPVLLRQSMPPTLSGSTSEHRGSHKHCGFEHCGSEHRGSEHRGSNKHRGFEHRGSNDHIGLNKQRGLEHRGFTEHRGSIRFHTQPRVATSG